MVTLNEEFRPLSVKSVVSFIIGPSSNVMKPEAKREQLNETMNTSDINI